MAVLDDVLDLMRPHLGGGCPEISMKWAALQAARELCREARCLRRTIEIDTIAGYSRYRVEPNWLAITDEQVADRAAVEVIGFKAVEVEGTPCDPEGPESFRQTEGDGYVVIYEPDEIEIFPAPSTSSTGALRVNSILSIKAAATVIPSQLGPRYRDLIASGARAVLEEMPNETWSNPSMATWRRQQFMTGIASARTRADMQARPRGFRVKAYV